MPKQTELCSVKFEEGKYRFCLDNVIKEDGAMEYCFIWRGTKKSPDAIVPKPAYFTFDVLGNLLNEAIKGNKISANHLRELLSNMFSDERE
jgi:hypothetical protein